MHEYYVNIMSSNLHKKRLSGLVGSKQTDIVYNMNESKRGLQERHIYIYIHIQRERERERGTCHWCEEH